MIGFALAAFDPVIKVCDGAGGGGGASDCMLYVGGDRFLRGAAELSHQLQRGICFLLRKFTMTPDPFAHFLESIRR